MNNYDAMQEAARLRFLEYDPATLAGKPGIADGGDHLQTCFLGRQVRIQKQDGCILLDGRAAGFGESLSIYDWLCDSRAGAVPAGEYCALGSLPGIYVGGGNLSIEMPRLARAIQSDPQHFRRICGEMGGREVALADLTVCLPIFPNLPLYLKFYFADEEFPPQLTPLWDRNMLQFVRYETVYYIAGCLQEYLLRRMDETI